MILGAIVLAGGRSRRMGQAKESLPLGDSTLLGRCVDTLMDCCHPVVVVARDPEQELPPFALEAELVFDSTPDQGPLRGIHAGMSAAAASCDAVFVTGCDHPFLDRRSIQGLSAMLGDASLVMPRHDGRLQPLAAIYRCELLPRITALLEEGVQTPRSLADEPRARLLETGDLQGFDPGLRLLRNLNTPEDYQRALAELGY